MKGTADDGMTERGMDRERTAKEWDRRTGQKERVNAN